MMTADSTRSNNAELIGVMPGPAPSTLPLWRRYGLFSLSGQAARLGGGDKDLALLFTLVAADRYLTPGGRIAVLITIEAL